MEDNNFIKAMPESLKPSGLEPEKPFNMHPEKKKRRIGRIIVWLIVFLVVFFAVVQYLNASKYEALVQVIKEDKIGVNPTGERLDFGDLPRDKSATRNVTLSSKGSTGTYIMVWKFGDISDLLKVNKNYFTLKPGTTEKLEFSVYVPNSADYRYYRGKVIIFQIPKIW